MATDLLTLFAVWLFSRCGAGGAGGSVLAPAVPSTPGGQPGWPGSPIVLPTSTPPWPQVPSAPPTDLPPFPGAAWEFDEPPPAAVKTRAGQLVSSLWARGSGAYQVERTAGRWIAYQAQVVASGKRGVVAYRIKRPAAALPAGATASRSSPRAAAPRARPAAPRAPAPATASRPPAAPAAPRPAVPTVPVASSPLSLPELRRGAGMPPAAPSADVVLLQQKLGIPADGRFGAGTETAVKDFQRRNGLTTAKWPQGDGIVGPRTWTKLFAVRA